MYNEGFGLAAEAFLLKSKCYATSLTATAYVYI